MANDLLTVKQNTTEISFINSYKLSLIKMSLINLLNQSYSTSSSPSPIHKDTSPSQVSLIIPHHLINHPILSIINEIKQPSNQLLSTLSDIIYGYEIEKNTENQLKILQAKIYQMVRDEFVFLSQSIILFINLYNEK